MCFLPNQKLYTHVHSLKCVIGFLKKKLYYFQLQSNNWYFPVCRCTLEQPLPLSSTLATWGSTSQHERSWWPTTFNRTNLPNTLVSSRSNVKNIYLQLCCICWGMQGEMFYFLYIFTKICIVHWHAFLNLHGTKYMHIQ